MQTETLEIIMITGQKRGMFKGSLDLLRDADTIFKCCLPDLSNHLSLKSHSPTRLAFYLLFNIRERWKTSRVEIFKSDLRLEYDSISSPLNGDIMR